MQASSSFPEVRQVGRLMSGFEYVTSYHNTYTRCPKTELVQVTQ